MSLGDVIRRRRKEKHMTQDQVCAKVGISKPYLSNIETGRAKNPPTDGVIRGLLFGVAPHDPVTLISVAVMMAAIGLGACWIPALRAARIDPAITMRS